MGKKGGIYIEYIWEEGPCDSPTFLLHSVCLLGKSSSIFRKVSKSAVGAVGSAQTQSLPCSSLYLFPKSTIWCSVQFSCSVVSNSLRPHEPQHARPPCPSPTPGVYPNSCPFNRWCHLTISSSVIPFSSCLQFFPTLGSFQMSQIFSSGGQNIGASASTSVLPMNIQGWFPLGWTGLISLQSKGLSRVFSNTTVREYQFFGAQPSLWSNSHIHTWLLQKP